MSLGLLYMSDHLIITIIVSDIVLLHMSVFSGLMISEDSSLLLFDLIS